MKLRSGRERTGGFQLLRIVLICLFAWACATAQPAAAPVSNSSTDRSVDALLQKIQQLEAAQKQMQERLDKVTGTAALVPSTPVPVVAPAPPPPEPVVEESASSDSNDGLHTLGPVVFRGYSDFNYGRAWFEKMPPGGLGGSPRSFGIGDFDLFTNTQISPHWSILGELLVTSDFSNTFGAELDRLLFTYKQNDYFKISFGKFSTGLGYYSNAFHRAQYFQTGIGRPLMYSDEDNGGILPTHSVGVTATGKIPSGALGLHWLAEVANGRATGDVPLQNFVDQNNGKAVNFQIYARPEGIRGFQTGFSVYRDRLYPEAGEQIQQTILTAHVVYSGSKLEWLNEGSMVRHQMHDGGHVFNSTTGYSQLGWAVGKTRPYVRFDYLNAPGSDPIYGSIGRRSGTSFGVNRHISNYVVLKVQYGRLNDRHAPSAYGLTGQLAFAF